MSFCKSLRYMFVLATLLLLAGTASAQDGSCTNCSSVSSNLTLSATVQTAIQLTITTNGGATVSDSGGGAYTIPFGNVNGLGVGTPASGVSVSTSGSGATYTSPISVTPSFSGFTDETATVKVYQDSTASSASQSAAREGGAAGTVATVPTTSGTATTVTTTASSATGITRYVGVFISNANGVSAVSGSLAPKFIYQVSVP